MRKVPNCEGIECSRRPVGCLLSGSCFSLYVCDLVCDPLCDLVCDPVCAPCFPMS